MIVEYEYWQTVCQREMCEAVRVNTNMQCRLLWNPESAIIFVTCGTLKYSI
jgi:hypothetical protein